MHRDDWPFGLLVREAILNIFGPGSRMLVILALAVLAGAGSSTYIAVQSQAVRQEVFDLAADGRNVLVISALSNDAPSSINRASCENLHKQQGVDHAGILESAGELDVLPVGTRLPAQRASTTLFRELTNTDLLVGRNLSDRVSRQFTVRSGRDLASAKHADPHPEDLGTSFSVTLPPHPSHPSTARCVVILNAFSDADLASSIIAAQLKVTKNPISVTELLTATTNPVDNYLQRVDRWFPVLLGLLGAVAAVVTTRRRASEIAVYRMSGTSPVSMMTLLTLETLLITGSAALSATAAALTLSSYYLDLAVPILWGCVLAGSWAIFAIVALLDLGVRRPSELAKDR
ncbi:hypothetical protein GCM10027586_14240 [Kineococcus gypseus]